MIASKKAWVLWFLGALLFFSEYFVRTSSSVMVGDLMHDFAVDASGIGTLSAFFYYPYTLMQIPVGVLVDRFQSGKLLSIMSVVFASGCLIFSYSNSIYVAEMSRALMGFSAAFAFVGTLKLVTESFDSKMLGLLAGSTQALGMLGAATGEGPVSEAVRYIGWRSAMTWMGLFIAMISALLFIFAWNYKYKIKTSRSRLISDISKGIIFNKYVLLNALFAGLLYAPTLAFGELWGVSYLETVHDLTHSEASSSLSWIFIGWGIGGPFQGLISDRIGKRKPLLYFSACCSLIFMCVTLFLPVSYAVLIFIMFCYGFSNSGLVVSYAISGEINPARQTGATIAFTNMASVFLGTCCQPLIGYLLVYYWSGVKNNLGVPIYDAHAYKNAMIFLPVMLLMAILVALFIKETNCKKGGVNELKSNWW